MKTYQVTLSHFRNPEETVSRVYKTETIFEATAKAREEFKETPYIVDSAELLGGPGKETLTCRKRKVR